MLPSVGSDVPKSWCHRSPRFANPVTDGGSSEAIQLAVRIAYPPTSTYLRQVQLRHTLSAVSMQRTRCAAAVIRDLVLRSNRECRWYFHGRPPRRPGGRLAIFLRAHLPDRRVRCHTREPGRLGRLPIKSKSACCRQRVHRGSPSYAGRAGTPHPISAAR